MKVTIVGLLSPQLPNAPEVDDRGPARGHSARWITTSNTTALVPHDQASKQKPLVVLEADVVLACVLLTHVFRRWAHSKGESATDFLRAGID